MNRPNDILDITNYWLRYGTVNTGTVLLYTSITIMKPSKHNNCNNKSITRVRFLRRRQFITNSLNDYDTRTSITKQRLDGLVFNGIQICIPVEASPHILVASLELLSPVRRMLLWLTHSLLFLLNTAISFKHSDILIKDIYGWAQVIEGSTIPGEVGWTL